MSLLYLIEGERNYLNFGQKYASGILLFFDSHSVLRMTKAVTGPLRWAVVSVH